MSKVETVNKSYLYYVSVLLNVSLFTQVVISGFASTFPSWMNQVIHVPLHVSTLWIVLLAPPPWYFVTSGRKNALLLIPLQLSKREDAVRRDRVRNAQAPGKIRLNTVRNTKAWDLREAATFARFPGRTPFKWPRFLCEEVESNSWILLYRLPWAPKGTVQRLRRLCASRAALQWDFRCCFFYLCLLPSTWMWTTQRCIKDPAAVISATRWTFTCSSRGMFAFWTPKYCTNLNTLGENTKRSALQKSAYHAHISFVEICVLHQKFPFHIEQNI